MEGVRDILPALQALPGTVRATVVPPGEALSFNLYQIGGCTNQFKVDPRSLRKIWAEKCESVTFGCPAIRLGNGALVTKIKPTCVDPTSSFKARFSIDFDGIPSVEGDFEAADIFGAVCDFLQEYMETDGIVFAKEPASLFYGPHPTKHRTCHLIFHDLCHPQDPDHFARATKNGEIHKRFQEAMKPFGLDADICLTGLRWEYTDKQDPYPQAQQQPGDILAFGKSWRWRGKSTPLKQQFNAFFVGYEDLANSIDPHVLVEDVAWNREVTWKVLQGKQKKQATKAAVAAANTVAVNGAEPWERLCNAFPGVFEPNTEVLAKPNGAGFVPMTNKCPLKKVATDSPIHEHGSNGKFWFTVTASGDIVTSCVICGKGPIIKEQVEEESAHPEVLEYFNQRFARLNNKAFALPRLQNGHWVTDYSLYGRASFGEHWMCSVKMAGPPLECRDSFGKKMFIKRCDYWWEFPTQDHVYHQLLYQPYHGPAPALLPKVFNTFLGFNPKIEAFRAEMEAMTDAQLMNEWKFQREHMLSNICQNNEAEYKSVLGFFQDIIVHPERKPKWALVLQGDQGSGKGLMIDFHAAIYGPQNWLHANNRGLAGKFNAAVMNKLLVYADEGIDTADKSVIQYLKSLVTEVSQTVSQKSQAEYQQDTCFRIAIATNNEIDFIPSGDRRFFLLSIPINPELKKHQIAAETQGLRGPAAFYFWTLRQEAQGKLSDFDVYEVPKSEAKTRLLMQHFDLYDTWVLRILRQEISVCSNYVGSEATEKFLCPEGVELCDLGSYAWKGIEVPKNLVYNGFLESLATHEARKVSSSAFWLRMFRYLPGWNERRVRVPDIPKERRVSVVTLPSLELFRERFRNMHKLEASFFQVAAQN